MNLKENDSKPHESKSSKNQCKETEHQREWKPTRKWEAQTKRAFFPKYGPVTFVNWFSPPIQSWNDKYRIKTAKQKIKNQSSDSQDCFTVILWWGHQYKRTAKRAWVKNTKNMFKKRSKSYKNEQKCQKMQKKTIKIAFKDTN